MAFRIAQTVLVAAVALLLTLPALNNLTDYGSNFQYVAHVVSMDTTFPDNQLKWRALSMAAETGGISRAVIPAQAGIQCFAPGFRVSRCSPGMTGCHEWPVGVEDFVSEQQGEAIFARKQRLLRRVPLLTMTASTPLFVQSFVSRS